MAEFACALAAAVPNHVRGSSDRAQGLAAAMAARGKKLHALAQQQRACETTPEHALLSPGAAGARGGSEASRRARAPAGAAAAAAQAPTATPATAIAVPQPEEQQQDNVSLDVCVAVSCHSGVPACHYSFSH